MRGIRLLGLSVAAGVLTSTAFLMVSTSTAGAVQPGLCTLLPVLCPTTTVAKASPTTAAPATTAPATTKATATTRPPVAATRTTTAGRNTSSVATVGDGALPAPSGGAGTAAASNDDAAPQLAGLPAPNTAPAAVAPTPDPLPGLVGATKGLPNDHSTLRVTLSILVLFVAVVAAAQLPASRRSPTPRPESFG